MSVLDLAVAHHEALTSALAEGLGAREMRQSDRAAIVHLAQTASAAVERALLYREGSRVLSRRRGPGRAPSLP